MIGSIKGKIVLRTEKFLIVETNGVGYKINVSSDVFSKAKKTEIMLWIHTHVREDMKDEKGGISLQGELDALEALKSLGYSQNEAREALKKISLGHGRTGEVPDTNTNAKIREALKILSGK